MRHKIQEVYRSGCWRIVAGKEDDGSLCFVAKQTSTGRMSCYRWDGEFTKASGPEVPMFIKRVMSSRLSEV